NRKILGWKKCRNRPCVLFRGLVWRLLSIAENGGIARLECRDISYGGRICESMEHAHMERNDVRGRAVGSRDSQQRGLANYVGRHEREPERRFRCFLPFFRRCSFSGFTASLAGSSCGAHPRRDILSSSRHLGRQLLARNYDAYNEIGASDSKIGPILDPFPIHASANGRYERQPGDNRPGRRNAESGNSTSLRSAGFLVSDAALA